MRVVFDTNIFIAAAQTGGFAENLIEMAATNVVTLVTSEEILKELSQKLKSKFNWSQDRINFYLDRIRQVAKIVESTEVVTIVKNDPTDNKILSVAIFAKADLIVSSDQDLITLKKFKGIGIVHPRTLAWTFPQYFKSQK